MHLCVVDIGDLLQNELHVIRKAHVQHLVRLVKDDMVARVQRWSKAAQNEIILGREKFCPGKLTSEKFCPVKILSQNFGQKFSQRKFSRAEFFPPR